MYRRLAFTLAAIGLALGLTAATPHDPAPDIPQTVACDDGNGYACEPVAGVDQECLRVGLDVFACAPVADCDDGNADELASAPRVLTDDAPTFRARQLYHATLKPKAKAGPCTGSASTLEHGEASQPYRTGIAWQAERLHPLRC